MIKNNSILDKKIKKTDNIARKHKSNVVYIKKHPTQKKQTEIDLEMEKSIVVRALQIEEIKDLLKAKHFCIEERITRFSCVEDRGAFTIFLKSVFEMAEIIDRLREGEDIEEFTIDGILEDCNGFSRSASVVLKWKPEDTTWIVDWVF